MKRAFLTDLGITDSDVIKKIIDFHQGVVQDLKDDLSTANTTLKTAQNDLKTANKTIEDLKSKPDDSNGGEDYKQKYNDEVSAHNTTKTTLKKELDDYKNAVETEKTTATKQAALRKQLQADGANPKMIDLLELKFDLTKVELDGEKVKDWENLSKPVKEQYADVFGKVEDKGTPQVIPPAGNTPQDLFIAGFDGK